MAYKRLSWVFVLCISVTTYHNQATDSGPGKDEGCCLKEVSNDVIDLKKYQSILNETECNSQCNTKDDCVGFYWRPNSTHGYECWLKIYATMTNGKHLSLVNCDGGNLPYCWKLKVKVHRENGVKKKTIKNEAACKQLCVVECNCIGVDWNVNKSECWALYPGPHQTKNHSHQIHHWIIVRNALRTCTSFIDANATWSNSTAPESPTEDSSNNSTSTATHCMRQDLLNIVLGASLGVWTLVIIGISVCAVKAKKYSVAKKEVEKVKVDDVEMVKEAKVNNVYETREGDDESYIDYEDLTRRNCPNIRQEEDCVYTAMELENMKNIEDEDDVYCNEIQ